MRPFLSFFPLFLFLWLGFHSHTQAQSRPGSSTVSAATASQNTQRGLSNTIDSDNVGLSLLRTALPLEATIAPESYVLGPQDILSVDVKGTAGAYFPALVVSPLGEVSIPSVGTITVSGKTIAEAKTAISNVLLKQFPNAEITMNLLSARKIVVHISGDIPYPGQYYLEGLSRVDKAVFLGVADFSLEGRAFMPLSMGSSFNIAQLKTNDLGLRNILIRRADGSAVYADLLSYLYHGDLEANPTLQSGDVVQIFKITHETPRISLSGAISAPKEMEFRKGDTIQHLLQMGGIMLVNADQSYVNVYRVGAERIETIRVDAQQFASFNLQPNDRIVIPYVPNSALPATAWVIGEASFPGNFPILEGKTSVHDLIQLAGGLTTDILMNGAYIDRGNVTQRGNQNFYVAQQPNPELLKRTSDQYQQGFNYLDVETRVSANRVFVDLSDIEQLKSIYLYNGDRLYLPRDLKTVLVFGQVNNAGYYAIQSKGSTDSYISQAGGFSIAADKKRVFVIKAGSRAWFEEGKTTIESGDMIFVDRVPYDEFNSKRMYQNAQSNLLNSRISLILSAVSTTVLVLSFIRR